MADLVVDLFAGGGGASTGIEAALGRPIDVAINHDAVAIAVHAANHPETEHLTSDLWTVRPRNVTRGRHVRLLWASPDCRHFSIAKGGVPCHPKVRALASLVIRWAEEVRPDVILLENVQEFQTWGPLGRDGTPIKARKGENWRKWLRHLQRRGYAVDWRVLDASEFGAPTRRRRLFVVARCDGQPICWPTPTHGPGRLPLRTAAECIDWSLPCPSIFDRKRPLVEKTLWRIAQGLKRFVFENPRPFILKVNHGKWEPRHESLDAPLSVVTATQRGHALVAPTLQQSGYGERPGQRARVPGLNVPLGTLVNGQKHALVAAFLARYFGDPLRSDGGGGVVAGGELGNPLPTVTVRDHHGLAAVALELRPIGVREACAVVAQLHRHLPRVVGGLFASSVYVDGTLVGVGIASRPKARQSCDGYTVEITRIATDGHRNACSRLYGALTRAASAVGYRRAITFTRIDEPGTSPRAAGFRDDGVTSEESWDRPSRGRLKTPSKVRRWVRTLNETARALSEFGRSSCESERFGA